MHWAGWLWFLVLFRYCLLWHTHVQVCVGFHFSLTQRSGLNVLLFSYASIELFSHTQVSGVNAFILTHPGARPLQAYVISFLGLTLMISSLGKFSVNLYL